MIYLLSSRSLITLQYSKLVERNRKLYMKEPFAVIWKLFIQSQNFQTKKCLHILHHIETETLI